MKRYLIAALVVGVAVTGSLAMAASLGGISTDNLGADNTVVSSCDSDGVTTTYTVVYDATDARDEVTATVVGGVDATCAGQTMTVTLTTSADAVLDTTSAVAVSGTNTVSTTTAPAAEDVANVHVVITG